MIAKRIIPKRRFVKLFEQINFVIVGFEPTACSRVATCLTIWVTCSMYLNVHLSIFIYLLAQHPSRHGPFTRVGQAFGKIRGKKDALSGNRTQTPKGPTSRQPKAGKAQHGPTRMGDGVAGLVRRPKAGATARSQKLTKNTAPRQKLEPRIAWLRLSTKRNP